VDLVAKRLDADVCSLYLSGSDLSVLRLSATVGLHKDAVGRVELKLDEGLVGLAAERKEPVVIEHAREHPRYKYFPETGEERFESLMAAPLMVRGRAMGVLAVQTRVSRHFDRGDLHTLQTCAQLIAPVVVNARMLSAVEQSDEERALDNATLARVGIPIAGAKRLPPERNAKYHGIPTARGVAIGRIYKLGRPVDLARLDYAPSEDREREERDLMRALHEARRELDDIREDMGEQFGPDFASVFHIHIQILEDKSFVAKMRDAVRRSGDALEALRSVLSAYQRTFQRIEDPYFRERAWDIEDVGRRVAERLLGVRQDIPQLTQGAIVVVDNIMPGYFARLDLEKVGAIVSEHGGATSHGAIFARTLEIPALSGVAGIQEVTHGGETAIVDGGDGVIILAPDERLVSEYERARRRHAVAIQHLRGSGSFARSCSPWRTAAFPRKRSRSRSTSGSRRPWLRAASRSAAWTWEATRTSPTSAWAPRRIRSSAAARSASRWSVRGSSGPSSERSCGRAPWATCACCFPWSLLSPSCVRRAR
jgi:phosphotransferase system enzyme I (PtsP)